MPSYDARRYDPPAPVAQVTLRSTNRQTVSDVILLMDTGTYITLIPRSAIIRIGVTPVPSLKYEVVGFDGNRAMAQAVDLDMIFLQRVFRGRYLLTDDAWGILGRDVLESLVLVLDGPKKEWSEYTPPR
jgi:hypothetical protein